MLIVPGFVAAFAQQEGEIAEIDEHAVNIYILNDY
jgi:hypothetical protein